MTERTIDGHDRDTALHESAHAVLAWHSDSAVVSGVDLDQWITHMKLHPHTGTNPTVAMAGELVVYRAHGRQGPDWAHTWAALVDAVDGEQDADTDEESSSDQAALFAWLNQFPADNDRQAILDGCRAETVRRLDEYQEQIEAVARELVAHRQLDTDALAALLGEQQTAWWDR